MPDNNTVAGRLAATRAKRGMSQRELGALAGCSYAYVSRLEAGERTASVRLLRRFAEHLDVTAEWLETGHASFVQEGPFTPKLTRELLDRAREVGIKQRRRVRVTIEEVTG